MAYQVSNRYKEVIYSGDTKNKLKILFNNVEFANADVFCESLNVKSRLIAGTDERFSLDNFIAKEATLTLHEIDKNVIKSPVNISIGTLVDGTYEYVPIGVFNVQDKPTTDKDKTTIKLRDNAVLFDFNYNGKPLIDANGGKVTKMQILQDICSQANVELGVTTFNGENDEIGIYDNTIKARIYISYLAEQAGGIATIDRSGKLIFVYLKDAVTQKIPLEIVEKYEDGKPYEISRVVYEDAIRKYDSGDESKDTLYLNSANPYIFTQSQIDNILNNNKNIPISSFNTGKILGNPAIDCYDFIETTDNGKTYRTLASNEFTYNGVMINNFSTIIGEEARKENVSVNSEPTFKKWAKTEIDNVKAEVKITTGKVEQNKSDISELNIKSDRIESKVDSSLITIESVEGNGNLELTNSSSNNIVELSIKGDILLLFGNDGTQYGEPKFFNNDEYFSNEFILSSGVPILNTLYPSKDLFSKNMNLIIEYSPTDKKTIPLPFSYLNYIDDKNCDEFIIKNDKAYIIRRVGVNMNKQKYVLNKEIVKDLGIISIFLKEGTNKIYLESFVNLILKGKYILKNDVTDAYATKVEMNSAITQTAEQINLSVDQKISGIDKQLSSDITQTAEQINLSVDQKISGLNEQLSSDITLTANNITQEVKSLDENLTAKIETKVDTDKLVSEINASADNINLKGNRITIKSDSFDLSADGVINATSGTIGGWHITPTMLWAEIVPPYDYFESDVDRIKYIIQNSITPSAEEKLKYDINKDGKIDVVDLLIVKKLLLYNLQNSNPGKIVLDTTDWFNPIKIINSNGDILNSLDVEGKTQQ